MASAQYAFLIDVAKDMNHAEEMLTGITNMAIGEKAGKEHSENIEYFQGKAKGFSKRNYVGTITSSGKQGTSGICASRQHPGIMYAIIDGPKDRADGYDSNIYAYDANNASLVTKISLDVVNVDWEDIACGPCDTGGLGHCIYVSDTGHTGEGPVNLIYKVQEPEEVIQGRKLSLGEDEIEVIGFETSLENSGTLLVSPRGQLYIMDSLHEPGGLYEIVDGETKYLFDVAVPKKSKYIAPNGGDISPDGKAFLLKSQEDVFYWYVEKEEDMKSVLTDANQSIILPYLEEREGDSIAWSLDGASFFTLSEGENEPLFRYDRLT
ncbi:uncharacterized protein [Haliotis cracherodii]|uniref:uncharacterized protein n=1 Tax=Haliotis cracherodii TaxID=6455 RepID=UPI0039ECE382